MGGGRKPELFRTKTTIIHNVREIMNCCKQNYTIPQYGRLKKLQPLQTTTKFHKHKRCKKTWTVENKTTKLHNKGGGRKTTTAQNKNISQQEWWMKPRMVPNNTTLVFFHCRHTILPFLTNCMFPRLSPEPHLLSFTMSGKPRRLSSFTVPQ